MTMEPHTHTIRLLIVDDHPLVIAGIRMFLADHPHIQVVDEAHHGDEAIEKAMIYRPDIILMDITMPQKNGLEAAEILLKKLPDTKIIFLTMHPDKEYVRKIFNLGAEGYILKNEPQDNILKAIEVVYRGYAYYSPDALDKLWEIVHKDGVLTAPPRTSTELFTPVSTDEEIPELTSNEIQMLKLIVLEYSNKEIAEKYFISTRTVERHRFNIMQKLDIHTLGGLIKYAIKKGFLKL